MKQPISATIALGFVLLNAITSFLFGVMILMEWIPGIPDQMLLRIIMAGSAFVGAGLLLILYLLLVKRNRLAFYLIILILLFISALVFADEVGVADWIAFVGSATPAVFLLLARKWFLTP